MGDWVSAAADRIANVGHAAVAAGQAVGTTAAVALATAGAPGVGGAFSAAGAPPELTQAAMQTTSDILDLTDESLSGQREAEDAANAEQIAEAESAEHRGPDDDSTFAEDLVESPDDSDVDADQVDDGESTDVDADASDADSDYGDDSGDYGGDSYGGLI